MGDPSLTAVGDVRRPFGEAEANHVGGDDTPVGRQGGDHRAPIRPSSDAWARSMNEDDGSALADIMDVGADGAGLDGSADFRMRFTHDLISAARR